MFSLISTLNLLCLLQFKINVCVCGGGGGGEEADGEFVVVKMVYSLCLHLASSVTQGRKASCNIPG